jgi:hypothetical protein
MRSLLRYSRIPRSSNSESSSTFRRFRSIIELARVRFTEPGCCFVANTRPHRFGLPLTMALQLQSCLHPLPCPTHWVVHHSHFLIAEILGCGQPPQQLLNFSDCIPFHDRVHDPEMYLSPCCRNLLTLRSTPSPLFRPPDRQRFRQSVGSSSCPRSPAMTRCTTGPAARPTGDKLLAGCYYTSPFLRVARVEYLHFQFAAMLSILLSTSSAVTTSSVLFSPACGWRTGYALNAHSPRMGDRAWEGRGVATIEKSDPTSRHGAGHAAPSHVRSEGSLTPRAGGGRPELYAVGGALQYYRLPDAAQLVAAPTPHPHPPPPLRRETTETFAWLSFQS